MKPLLSFAAALCLAFTALLAAAPATAAPPRVEGARCQFPVARGTWVGFFDGGYGDTAPDGRDFISQVTIWRCFHSKAECVAWKYWAQTDYDKGPQLTWCRRK
jgi:hypothetical protein